MITTPILCFVVFPALAVVAVLLAVLALALLRLLCRVPFQRADTRLRVSIRWPRNMGMNSGVYLRSSCPLKNSSERA